MITEKLLDLSSTWGAEWVRYTDEHKDYTFKRKNFDGSRSIFLGALDGVQALYDGSRWDWRVSADYRFTPEVLAYVTVGTGFKGGGVTARPFDAAQALNGSFGPETVTAYEAGIASGVIIRNNVCRIISRMNQGEAPHRLNDQHQRRGGADFCNLFHAEAKRGTGVRNPASILFGQDDLEKAEIPEKGGHITVELALAIRFGRSRGYGFLRHPADVCEQYPLFLGPFTPFSVTSPLRPLAAFLMPIQIDFDLPLSRLKRRAHCRPRRG